MEGDGMRILVVDDNRDAALSLSLLLQKLGCEARAVFDAAHAMNEVGTLPPSLVLMDIGMPEVDGYELCRRMRKEPFGAGLFLVALTGWGQEEDKARAFEAGFDRHVVKPIDRQTLLALLNEVSERVNTTT